jgi:hypothetical protein
MPAVRGHGKRQRVGEAPSVRVAPSDLKPHISRSSSSFLDAD